MFWCRTSGHCSKTLTCQQTSKILYLNQVCSNLEMTFNNSSFSITKKFMFVYFNVFLIMMGQFFLYTVFVKETFSQTCLSGHECEKIFQDKNVTCETAILQNETNVKNFLCTRYGVESLDSFLQNVVIVYGVYMLLVNINNYLFKYSLAFFQFSRNESSRRPNSNSFLSKCKMIILKLFTYTCIMLIVCLPLVSFILWITLPVDVIRIDYSPVTRTDESKIISIVVTSFFSLLAGLNMSEKDEETFLLPVYDVVNY